MHCSAGVGRTGTIISVIELIEIWEEQSAEGILSKDCYFSVFGLVRRMREWRTMMVQSEQQYQFIYKQLRRMLSLAIKREDEGKF